MSLAINHSISETGVCSSAWSFKSATADRIHPEYPAPDETEHEKELRTVSGYIQLKKIKQVGHFWHKADFFNNFSAMTNINAINENLTAILRNPVSQNFQQR